MWRLAVALSAWALVLGGGVQAGDAVDAPIDGKVGEVGRGRAIVLDRASGNCLICHHVPVLYEPFQGNIGPDLAGVGGRLTAGQLRLRLMDQSVLNPSTMMPPYHRVMGLVRVAPQFDGKPILDAQQIEDVVAWLVSLKEAP